MARTCDFICCITTGWFGRYYAPILEEFARSFGRWAELRGDYIRLFPREGDPVEKSRIGNPRRIDLAQGDFTHVISSRARWNAHSSALEAHGVALVVRWATRNAVTHHRRIPLLVDAKAVVGAATKGRSSSGILRGPLRALAAMTLAADMLLRIIYIPSESNPSDAPSRGIRRRRNDTDAINKRRRTDASRMGTRLERRLDKYFEWQASVERMFRRCRMGIQLTPHRQHPNSQY